MAKKRQTNKLAERLIDRGAWLVEETDRLLDQAGPFLGRQGDKIIDVCGDFVVKFDEGEDVVAWFLGKTFVHAARKWHDMHIGLQKHRKEIVKHFAIGCVVIVGAVGVYATSIDYEYAYNGRTLGIVKEQRDVLEILDLVSEALTQEYGSSIVIDPETDITFKPVIKFGKEIDDPDTVLRRFTYMGDIQTQAYAIMVNGERMITVENEAIAQEVLDSILDSYIKGDRSDYESVGFTEDIKIEAYHTTLANVSSKAAATKKLKSGGQQELTYEVVAGDTLYGICNKLGVSLSELKEMNPRIKDTMVLHVGDKFVTQQEVPLLTVETVEIATFAESIDYETKHKESSAYYKGETIVTQAGEKGKARVTARLTKQNGKTVERKDLSVKTIKEPVSKIVIKGTKALPPTKGTGRFIRPVSAECTMVWTTRRRRERRFVQPTAVRSPRPAGRALTAIVSLSTTAADSRRCTRTAVASAYPQGRGYIRDRKSVQSAIPDAAPAHIATSRSSRTAPTSTRRAICNENKKHDREGPRGLSLFI